MARFHLSSLSSGPLRGRTRVGLASVLALVLTPLLVPSPGVAQEPPRPTAPAPVQGPVQGVVEIDGVRELSGWMISRPVQPEAWVASGLSQAQARTRAAQARQEMDAYQVREHVPQTDEYVFRVPAGDDENRVIARLMGSGLFQYVEPDWILFPIACPDDSLFGNQWHHQANRMQSCAGWDLHTGNPSVSVGICDTGVRTSHEDLQLHRLEGYNAVDRVWESQGGSIGPVHPHGTQTTGCAAANGNNGVGVSGVGWNLSHRMLRVSNSSGGGAFMSDLQHAARTSIESGDRAASVSYSGADTSSNLTTATYIKSIGGLLVWAAGNDGRNLTFGDRDADDMIVVGATDEGDGSAWFSAFGSFVDLTAPGVNVATTTATSDSAYSAVSGTSFSTPLTAGLIALIWSADPSQTPDQVESVLKQAADDLGSAGLDNVFGYGRINVFNAMTIVGGGGGGGNPPVADFSGTPTSGNAPLTVNFTDLSSGSPTSWSWDFGDGNTSTAQHPSHVYSAAGGYTVSLTATNADGSDTFVRTNYISVSSGGGVTGEGYILSKNSDFSTDDRAFARTDTIYMKVWTDQVDPGDIKKRQWELRDANKQKVKQPLTNNGDFTYTASFDLVNLPSNATDWTWKAKVQDNAGNSFAPTDAITVSSGGGSPPVADFSGTPTSGTAPLTVDFTDLSSGSPISWSWDFGDGGTSTVQHPTYVYANPGTFAVSLTVTNSSGSDTLVRSGYISVSPGGGTPPTADFSGTPTSGAAPLTVTFTDLSTGGPTSWAWDFGDGSTSSAQHPVHVYDAQGLYTVSLTATNADGSDTLVQTDFINVTGGGNTGEGFILSRSPDFSTDDRSFTRSETIYMLVWSDQVDFTDMRKAQWELKDANKKKVKKTLTNNGDGTFSASFTLSSLPSNATDWTWKAKIEDNSRTKFNPTTTITVLP